VSRFGQLLPLMLTHPLTHENFNQNCPTTFSIDRLSDGWNFLPTLNFPPLNFLPHAECCGPS
jgi:hypothetical protein